jgi:hypothetical protein
LVESSATRFRFHFDLTVRTGLLEASYDKNPPNKIGEFQLDTQLTNEYVKVYFSISKRKVVIIHRGTGSLPDWRFNLVYGLNSNAYNLTSRYKNSKNIQKKTQEKYRGYKIKTLGHSQGALLAHKLGEKSHSIIELNPAYKGERQLKNEYIIRSSLDPVSALKAPINSINKVLYPSYTRKHNITIPAKTMNPLTEHSIDILNRLPQDKFIGTAGSFYKKNKKYVIESEFPFD